MSFSGHAGFGVKLLDVDTVPGVQAGVPLAVTGSCHGGQGEDVQPERGLAKRVETEDIVSMSRCSSISSHLMVPAYLSLPQAEKMNTRLWF